MKIQSPWMGRIRGSAGNMTGCKTYDKNVMRAKAFEVSNPRTIAQVTQRDFFTELTALCSGFTAEQLRCLFPQKPKAMSRRNAISKQIAENYSVDGTTKTINFATIDTLGNAKVMDFGNTSISWDEGTIDVELDQKVTENTSLSDNYFFAILVNETKGEILMSPTFAKVVTGSVTINIPESWLNTNIVHAIPFVTNNKTSPSGFGTIGVTKRPPRKND